MLNQEPFLNLKPQNLPVYVYHLDADIALVHDRLAYRIRSYQFSKIVVAVNQPLRSGDVLTTNSCYFGNECVELISHMQSKGLLNGAAKELKYYYGCRIDELAINFINPVESVAWSSCGEGRCTVYIELSASDLGKKFKALNDLDEEDLSQTDKVYLNSLREEYYISHSLDYWKQRIPKWDDWLECLGEVPSDLSY